jgi:hypothetical protein
VRKPYLTFLREALRDRLKAVPELAGLFGPRVFLNRSEAFDERELPLMGIYLDEVTPIENDFHPRRDLRKATVTMEVLANGKDLEGTLDSVDFLIKEALTIGPLEALIKENGGPDWVPVGGSPLQAIEWIASGLGYLPEATEVIGALVTSYEFEFINPLDPIDMPYFGDANFRVTISETAAE